MHLLLTLNWELSNPSTIFEQEKLEIWQTKVNLAADMKESNMFSKTWMYNNIFNMSDADIETLQNEVVGDKKEEWRLQQITDEGSDPAFANKGGGGGGGEAAPELGGAELGGGEAGGAEAGGGEAGGELPPLEEETRKDRERGNRDQTGNKEKYTSSHTKNFGEDTLGNKENKEKSKTERRTRHIYRGSALSLEEDLKNIKNSLKSKQINKQKKIIMEEKSILDESNIIEEDKPL